MIVEVDTASVGPICVVVKQNLGYAVFSNEMGCRTDVDGLGSLLSFPSGKFRLSVNCAHFFLTDGQNRYGPMAFQFWFLMGSHSTPGMSQILSD